MLSKENGEIIKSKLFESIKLREICDHMGIEDREAKLMVQIHTISQKGALGIRVFEDKTVYDQILTSFPSDIIKQVDKQFELMIGKNYFSEQIEDLLRMFTDEHFRRENYTTYQGILPRLYQQRTPQVLM